ncbi:efflux transporter outer membrane subunit [Desulfovibrio aminophilus]|uniref:efflux transporter outer membrane subunit n=1 Tax=Desulfovibrio aminophilus TaxID=81425 RepID=UPI003391D562
MSAWRVLAALILALACAGCAAVGPDYARPELAAPEGFSEAGDASAVPPALELAAWWRGFGDPELDSLMERAARSNLDLEQARARVAQARATLRSARGGFWPTLDASGEVDRSKDSKNAVEGATYSSGKTSTLYKAGFDASWELDLFGRTRRSVESAEASLEAGREDLHNTLLTLLGDVATSYVSLRSNQSRLAIARATLESQSQTVEVTRARWRAGLVSRLDVTQAESQRAGTEADIPGLELEIKQAMHRLAILLGQAPGALKSELAAVRPLPEPGKAVLATGLPAQLLSRRPDLRASERRLAAASADIGVATAGLYPTFDLTLGLGLQSAGNNTFVSNASRYWSIVPGVTIPIFSGGTTLAAIEQKRAIYDEDLAAYRAAFLTALEDVENALASYYAQTARRVSLAEAARTAEESVSLARERYAKGLVNFLDVLSAQDTRYSAQDSLDQCRADQLTALVALYKALGGGWAAESVVQEEDGGAAGSSPAPRAEAVAAPNP